MQNAEEKTQMETLTYPASSTSSVQLADALLKAWIKADDETFKAELDKSARACRTALNGGEDERLELLGAIANQLKQSPPRQRRTSPDPALGLFVDLLVHLAGWNSSRG